MHPRPWADTTSPPVPNVREGIAISRPYRPGRRFRPGRVTSEGGNQPIDGGGLGAHRDNRTELHALALVFGWERHLGQVQPVGRFGCGIGLTRPVADARSHPWARYSITGMLLSKALLH